MEFSREVELILYSHDVRFMVDYISPLLVSDERWRTICRACDREIRENGGLHEEMRSLIYEQFEKLFEWPEHAPPRAPGATARGNDDEWEMEGGVPF